MGKQVAWWINQTLLNDVAMKVFLYLKRLLQDFLN